MPNIFMDFKKYLLFLSPDEQICEINKAINYLTKSNRKKMWIKIRMLKELRLIKTILSSHYTELLFFINSHTNCLF